MSDFAEEVADAEAKQKAYSRKRALRARWLRRPFSDEYDLPPPGEFDAIDETEG